MLTRARRYIFASLLVFAALFGGALQPPPAALAATVPSGFTDSTFVQGLNSPTAMEFAPDGRIFVTQKGGAVRVVEDGVLLPEPFVTVDAETNTDRGLLGITLDPSFETNGWVYIYYVDAEDLMNRVVRYTANGNRAASNSDVVVFTVDSSGSAPIHDGGALHFGEDGRLYVAVGDNGTGPNSQLLTNLNGKILRLNADGTIPQTNPFYALLSGDNRAIWAFGLRNPFTFAFQPETGRMYINDVGGATWEEINEGVAGANYGWPWTEGPTANPVFRGPIHAYRHGPECAVTAGTFYDSDNPQFPSQYLGKYFFADLCAGWIRYLDPVSKSVSDFASGFSGLVDLDVGPDGALYYVSNFGGAIGRIERLIDGPPEITIQPADKLQTIGRTVTFEVSASGTPPLEYQWQRNGVDISGADESSYTTPNLTIANNNDLYTVTVTNDFGDVTSREAKLTVTLTQPPLATILTPLPPLRYEGGQTVLYSGAGLDLEDGILPASAFTWRVDFHHDDHVHFFKAAVSGSRNGSFEIPATGETDPDVFYRTYLTVKDSLGLEHTTFRDVRPRLANITLATTPAGLEVTLDGQPRTGGTVSSVVGLTRSLGAVSPQRFEGKTYYFDSWSDGGDEQHDITSPATNTTYTARYNVDTDDDGYVDVDELALGENPNLFCAIMRADVDGDGEVSILDLATVASLFGQTVPPVNGRINQDTDLEISILDLAAVAGQFGKPDTDCP